jgi:hypothetical protein
LEPNLTILLALPALLAATALLATLLTTLASGLLLLLTGLLLAALLATLLAALLTALLLLPALLHITHLVVRHGELSFAEGIRARRQSFGAYLGSLANKTLGQQCRNNGANPPLAQIIGMRACITRAAPAKWASSNAQTPFPF